MPLSLSILENNTRNNEREIVCKILRAFIEKEIIIKNTEISKSDSRRTVSDLPDNINWQLFEKIAARNGLIAIIQSAFGSSNIPEERREKWRRHSIKTLLNYKKSEKATAILFQILEKEHLPAVAMRGMALT